MSYYSFSDVAQRNQSCVTEKNNTKQLDPRSAEEFVMCVAFILPGEYTKDWPRLGILPAAFFRGDSWDLRIEKHTCDAAQGASPHASGDDRNNPCKSKSIQT